MIFIYDIIINNMAAERRTDTQNAYKKMHEKKLHAKNPGAIYDKNTLSIMVMKHNDNDKDNNKINKVYLVDLIYINLNDAYEMYIVQKNENYPEPYSTIPVFCLDLLKKRIIYKSSYNMYNEIMQKSYTIDNCYERYWNNECNESEICYLENELTFDDKMLVDWIGLENEYKLREQAVKIVQERENGSWLVRRSSIRESDHVKVRVFTIKHNQMILNCLCLHIDGFGYATSVGTQGDVIAKIGELKTISVGEKFESLIKLLDHLKSTLGIKMDGMVQNGSNYVVTSHI